MEIGGRIDLPFCGSVGTGKISISGEFGERRVRQELHRESIFFKISRTLTSSIAQRRTDPQDEQTISRGTC